MALVKWKNREVFDPWGDMKALQEEINELFDMDRFPRTAGLFERTFSPAIDVCENPNDCVVSCELPGIDKKENDISIASNVLTIKGQKKGETEEKRGKYYRKESWSGSFHRTLPLPSLVDGDKITAQLSNGVLTITLPKREEAKPKQIAVNVT